MSFPRSSAAGRSAPREEDDSGPEDDRVTFTVSTAARDREARRDQFNAARDQGASGGRRYLAHRPELVVINRL